MGTIEEYKARNAQREARRAEKQQPPKKEPWWFNQPIPIDRFTGWLVAFTFLLCAATTVSAVVLYRTDEAAHQAAEAAQKSADLAKEALIASQRPWLAAEASVGGPLKFEQTGADLLINVTIKNTGITPALFARISVFLDVTGLAKGYELCRLERDRESIIFSETIFPGTTVSRKQRAEIVGDLANLPDGIVKAPFLTVCVDYRTPVDDVRHQTILQLTLSKKGEGWTIGPGEIPASELLLNSIFGGDWAD